MLAQVPITAVLVAIGAASALWSGVPLAALCWLVLGGVMPLALVFLQEHALRTRFLAERDRKP